jgi:hypothetical protein
MRSNNVVYDLPKPRQPGKKGAPQKHGARFKLSSPARPADDAESFLLGSQTVRVQAWQGLHLKKLPKLVVMLLRVEFLKPDGQPRYKQPMWLLWMRGFVICAILPLLHAKRAARLAALF